MERIFSKRLDALRAAAGDDVERKLLTGYLLRFRRVFLCAALPLVFSLVGITVILLSHYLAVMRGTTAATFFLKIVDIFSIYTGSILFITFACLYLVRASDKKLRHLSSLRPDCKECDDPVAVFPVRSERENESDIAEAKDPAVSDLPEKSEEAIPTPSGNDPDTSPE